MFKSGAEVIPGVFDPTVQQPVENIGRLLTEHAPHSAAEDMAVHTLRHTGPTPTEEDLIGAIACGILIRLEENHLMSGTS